MAIYILQGEERKGPFTEEELKSFVDQGVFAREDLAWQEGWEEWRPLGSLLDPADDTAATEPGEPVEESPEELPQEEGGIDEFGAELATPRLLALLSVYGIEHAPRISKEVALALLQERDLSKPIPASAWQDYQKKFPPSAKKRTRSERIEWLLKEILEEHDVSYWTPDDASVREILEYMDHRFKGWEIRVNSYDLIDRGIRAFYPPPSKRMLEHEVSKKSIVVEMRQKKARKAHFLEGLGISLVIVGLFLIGIFGRLIVVLGHYTSINFIGLVVGLVALTYGVRSVSASRRAEQ
jgi:hypothetical protein